MARNKISLPADGRAPDHAARAAGLHYVTDNGPGIRRAGRNGRFTYLSPSNRPIRDGDTLARIRSLAIPPAWTDVWICPNPDGHLQATGRDARRRKQYRYHPRWREVRDETKYDKMILFAKAVPAIRRKVEEHLALPGLPREKVLATLVRLLETTFIRVGNEEYSKQNKSFGLTTMRDHHARINGAQVRFQFRGKSGIQHAIDLNDPHLARIIRRCQELPGEELFQYVDDHGAVRDIKSDDVNQYLREITGQDFTAKDFRTWAGTVLAAIALREIAPSPSQRKMRQNIVRAVESVARLLGNTTAVCRKCYIHPAIFDAYLDGALIEAVRQRITRRIRQEGLRPDEADVLRLLEQRLHRTDARKPRRKAG